jgi:hypothetical protein
MIKLLLLLSIIIAAFTPRFSLCQENLQENKNRNEIINSRSRIIFISDSLLAVEKIFTQTLFSKLKEKSLDAVIKFSASADSISSNVNDSLFLVRRDSLKLVRSSLQKSIIANLESFHQKLTNIPGSYSEKVNSIKQLTFDDESDVSDTLGIIDEKFRDALTSSVDDYYDNLNDFVDNAVDSLGNYSQSLLDNQNDENDLLDSLRDYYYSYGLFGKIGYTSDMQYRGYQGAGAQSAFFPGLFYNHPIGLGIFLNVYNIKGTTVPWDEIELGASYTHNFNEKLSMSLSYTHYTFNDTSETSKQGLTGIAGVNLGYEFSLFTVGTSFEISFGDQTDYSFIVNFSKRIELAKKITFQSWLEPDFSGIYGTESFLNNKIIRKINGKSKVVKNILTTTTNHALSVLAYQFSLPLNIVIGRFIITPEYDYVIPLNQPPFTDSNAFGFFTINVSVKIF